MFQSRLRLLRPPCNASVIDGGAMQSDMQNVTVTILSVYPLVRYDEPNREAKWTEVYRIAREVRSTLLFIMV